jgi:ferric-dicitrate binding protein FerR (iron transport regulator)
MESRSDRVDQEAAEWVVRLGEPDTEDSKVKKQFLRWLLLSPEHKQAFTQTVEVFCALGKLDRSRRIDVQELIRRGSPKIIPLLVSLHGEKLAEDTVESSGAGRFL